MKKVQNRNNIGNPYHDEQTGEFTSADKVNSLFGVEVKKESSRNFLPKITSSFTKRRFVEDLSKEEKERLR